MKAPDKIVIFPDDYPTLWYMPDGWETVPSGNVEYIRKDALLEKLKKVAAEYKKRSDEGELVWQNMCGINEAIDILNKI